jgi:hypothetical protein
MGLRAKDRGLATSTRATAGPEVSDQTIDAVMTAAIHADVSRAHPLVARAMMHDLFKVSGKLVGHLVMDLHSKYVLLADGVFAICAWLLTEPASSEAAAG